MEAIDKLVSKRKYLRGGVTKFITKVKNLLTSIKEGTEDDIEILTENLTLLEEKENELKNINSAVEALISDPIAYDKEVGSSLEYNELITSIKVKIKNRLKTFQREELEVSTVSQNLNRTSSPLTGFTSTVNNLPKLTIPTFSGDAHLFMDFYNSFLSVIDSNDSLTKIQKFIYLKSFLSGEAYQIVAGFTPTEENYASCLNLLKDRYGKSDRMISIFMNKLLEIEPVKNSSNIKGLRKIYDESEISIRNLNSLGISSENFGHLLIPLILKQLPHDMVVEYHRNRDPEISGDVKEVIKFIKTEIESREAAQLVSGSSFKYHEPSRPKQHFTNTKFRSTTPTAAALSTSFTKPFCIFCDSNTHTGLKCKVVSEEQKRFKLKKEGRCYRCFYKKHLVFQCKVKIQPCEKCQSVQHNVLFCPENKIKPETGNKLCEETKMNAKSDNKTVVSSILRARNNPKNLVTLLQTSDAFASNGIQKVCTKVLYDSGSQKTFIRKDLASKLELQPVGKESILIYTFSDREPKELEYDLVNLTLQSRIYPNKNIRIKAFVSDEIICAQVHANVNLEIIQNIQSQGFKLADTFDSKTPIQVLLGADYLFETLTGRINKINKNLYIQPSIFGLLLAGRIETFSTITSAALSVVYSESQFDLKRLWDIESFLLPEKGQDPAESCLMRNFESQLEYNGRYSAPLLWTDKHSRDKLSNNYDIAKRRFTSLQNRFERDFSLYEKYNDIMKEQLSEGIIEACNDNCTIGYVMPHREVYKESSITSQMRIVYDASSKQGNLKSLNDCLNSGDNLNPNLLDIILKFREHEIGFCADIARAFLQVEVSEEDRNYLCFLYYKNCDKTQPIVLYHFNRHCFGVTCSPFNLAATIKCHIKNYEDTHPLAFEMLNKHLYVDDLFFGNYSVEEAYKLTADALLILKDAKMNLRRFETNSPELRNLWRKSENFEVNENTNPVLKVLGLNWCTINDILSIDLKSLLSLLDDSQCTKRYVLHTAAKIFDPSGYITPFLMRIKCLLQDLWISGVEWDERVFGELKQKWEIWCSEIKLLENVTIPRYYFPNLDITNNEIQLHIFSDANPKCFGAVAYFRFKVLNGTYSTCFIMSKSRVAPIKKITLPRLELMGAIIAARIANHLNNIFPNLTSINLWCDSTIVLHWIKGPASKWKPFVSNRIIEIQQLTNPTSWKHCEGKLNPADMITKGCSSQELVTSTKWWYGPTWLNRHEHDWPITKGSLADTSKFKVEIVPELRSQTIISSTICTRRLIDFEKFSNMNKLRRVMAWVLRFIGKLKGENKEIGPISTNELGCAEELLIKSIQNEFYSTEINNLRTGKKVLNDSKLLNLNPFLDDKGILRVKGRLEKSGLTIDEKHPIIIPSKSRITELLIWEAHEKVYHSRISHTLAQTRNKYWIIKGRQTIKSVLRKCVICTRFSAPPGDQILAPLPADRVDETPPFTVIGLDYAGPLFCKDTNSKLYVLLITCAVTRALHLELVNNLTTETFLLAFRRFISRRGICSIIYSDNAKTFKRAEKDLQFIWSAINHPDVKKFYSSTGIKWKFIVEKAAWWGGFYERMVRTVKTALRKVLGQSSLTTDELSTLLVEIEGMINSRPITYISDCANEPQALTPAHFLLGKRISSLPPTRLHLESKISSQKVLTKAFNYRERLMKSFWSRWHKEYLLNLKSAYTSVPKGTIKEFKINDIVLIKDDYLPRNFWKLGKIIQVFQGRDGKVRSCLVKTQSSSVRRPVQLLYNLEVPNELID